MKAERWLPVIFVILYGIALIKPAFPLLEYYLDFEAYLEQCENRQKPELHCNGQCLLMQKLKALEPDSELPEAPAPATVNLQDYPIGFNDARLETTPSTHEQQLPYGQPIDLIASPPVSEIFHSPSPRYTGFPHRLLFC